MYKCQIETMSTVFLNKKRVKILKNSGESNYTPIHILQKKKKYRYIKCIQMNMFQVFF